LKIKNVFLTYVFLLLFVNDVSAAKYSGKKIVFVNSNHQGYEWSDGILRGVKSVLDGTGVKLKVIDMDSKRNNEEFFKKKMASQIKTTIDEFTPDLIIASEDNAVKYLVVPYYRHNYDIPVVFCGVKWSASEYELPRANITGVIEVALIPELIDILEEFSKGNRIGILGTDDYSNSKEAKIFKDKFGIVLKEEVFVSDIQDWKKEFVRLQESVDMLILAPFSILFINEDLSSLREIKEFVVKNTKIPTGTVEDWVAKFALIGIVKKADEQGILAAKAALKILDGVDPAEIPIAENEQGNLILNLAVAEKLDVLFAPSLIRSAIIIDKEF